MKIKTQKILDFNMPRKLIFKRKLHEITKISKKFTIKSYAIKTVDDKIDTVILNTPHPNANPRTGEFCIPYNLRDYPINKKSIEIIRTMLCCFNLDDCYFTPWDEIEYRK